MTGRDKDSRDRGPGEARTGREPRTYVTTVSVPRFGDGGVQRLHTPMKDPGPEPEADLSLIAHPDGRGRRGRHGTCPWSWECGLAGRCS
jgi:hypothetical protein